MSIFAWVIFGLISGAVANIIDPEPAQGGAIGAVMLGILGAVVGGLVANLIFGVGITGFNVPSFTVAILGAIALLMAGKALRRT